MALIQRIARMFNWGGALSDASGEQLSVPSRTVSKVVSPDTALQVSCVYACARILAGTVSSLPLMVYKNVGDGRRQIDRSGRLWMVLHERPNDLMTPSDFWQAMVLQYALRGNAYAQIMRDGDGDLVGLWPMSADQMTVFADKQSGQVVYRYYKDGKNIDLDPREVLHIKDVGTGLIGFSKLEFMGASVNEALSTQTYTQANAEAFGRPSGVLTVDHILDRKNGQSGKIAEALNTFKDGCSRMIVLEADMKFQQVALTPEQSQLLESRRYGVEEICRWFGVPPVLIGTSGATTWGSGISEIVSGFHKFTINPLIKTIEQAIEARVLSGDERDSISVEFSMDGLLRGDIQARYSAYATAVQNGFKTRNEVRQLENDMPLDGGDVLTAQSNLAPLKMLGKIQGTGSGKTDIGDIKQ